MLQRLCNLRKKGSSLMFIIIAVAFIGILATIVMRVTLTNIEMKSTDRSIKKNFYKTETVMDKLNITMENLSKDAMQDAYLSILADYSADGINNTDQNKIQNKFSRMYLDNLVVKLTSGSSVISNDYKLIGAKYDINLIRSTMATLFPASAEGMDITKFVLTPEDPQLELVFDSANYDSEKCLILKNMKVLYEEGTSATDLDAGLSTWITTDIKMIVPKLNFEGGNIYPDFTKYSIIGDEKVDVLTAVSNARVNGNIYAGWKGFNVSGQNSSGPTLTVEGSSTRVVTRGDVNVFQSGELVLGSEENEVEVWAENYRTSVLTGGDTPARLKVYGTSYIHDDLSIDAPNSDVVFGSGSYYGYSFNKDNKKDANTVVNSQYSSAIMINGRKSSLLMGDNMKEILLGGRAFISRYKDTSNVNLNEAKKKTDIKLGESIGIKSNQNFYLVAQEHLSEGFTNPMLLSKFEEKLAEGEDIMPRSVFDSYSLGKYLVRTQPVTTYYFDLSANDPNACMVYFYYNFKSQSAADLFFQKCFNKTELADKIKSSEYLKFAEDGGNGITISPNIALLSAGNVLTFKSKADGLKVTNPSITVGSDQEAFLKTTSIQRAAKYKSYQLTLTDSLWSKYTSASLAETANDTGFNLANKQDKTVFDCLMARVSKNGQHTFVSEALAGNSNACGFRNLYTVRGGVKFKAVKVELNSTTNAYAIFVVDTAVDSEELKLGNEIAVPVSDVTKVLRDELGYNTDSVAIIVSNCNVVVDENFRGLVVSDNTVSLLGSSKVLTAEPALLQAMFSKQKLREGNVGINERFMKYFVCFADMTYGEDVGQGVDTVDFSSYVQYVNWKKNNE